MHQYIVYRVDRSDGQAAAIRAATRPLHRDYMAQFAARVFSPEGDHQRIGERPALAAEVAQVVDLDPDLFAHFADHGILDRLAGF